MLKVHAKNLGTVAVLCLKGKIVNGETEPLREAVHSLAAVNAVILDLARVNTVDARGLGVLLELREQAQSRGIRFELMNLTRWVKQVLAVSRLDTVFQITSGVEFFPATSRIRQASVSALRSCA